METSAFDMNNPFNDEVVDPGFDFGSGYGFIDAEALGAIGSLPVELDDFTATAGGSDVLLRWRTLSETDNDRFRLLQETEDGRFEHVGAVPSQAPGGTTTETQTYRYRVTGVAPGSHTFRLVQIDRDGDEHFGAETSVGVRLGGAFHLSEARPNPFGSQTRFDLNVTETQDVSVELYNTLGQKVRTLYSGTIKEETTKTFTMEAGDLASGVYIYRVEGENFSDSGTVTLVR